MSQRTIQDEKEWLLFCETLFSLEVYMLAVVIVNYKQDQNDPT